MDDKIQSTKERLKQIVNQFAGKASEDESPVPEYVIKGSGDMFCFCPSKRMVVKVTRGTKAFIVDETLNFSKNVLIYTFNGDLVEIDPNELRYTGFD
jgi:hypothetical protein